MRIGSSLRFFESEDHDLSLKNHRCLEKTFSSFRILFDFRQLIDRSLISICSIYNPKGFICLISRQWKGPRTSHQENIKDYVQCTLKLPCVYRGRMHLSAGSKNNKFFSKSFMVSWCTFLFINYYIEAVSVKLKRFFWEYQ